MTISEKIYKLRMKSGFSQEVFAEKLDVTRQSVQKWESGLSLLYRLSRQRREAPKKDHWLGQ